ncbi:ASCH domain-containing protein [Paenibacillus hemerocallicola]|uniref:ASCH domain-containing protein n=1 Tax=Paenibacillus hemerocallicola TaxID=1172614 RepID=A0A5C4T6X0_9BACL|nr:ASCH domain-containing protein [Paenibacillus hemerocallicola]TNJ64813.1 ASCH domain-containing protein [Paenibacillus hemerocallicola]
MLFKQRILDGIADGVISVAFRRWKRASVKTGSRLHTPIGLLEITSIAVVPEREITETDAVRAGFSTRGELFKEIDSFSDEGDIFRIEVIRIGADPREQLRERDEMTDAEFADLRTRLERLDKASAHGPWTVKFLCLVNEHPGLRATDLAASIGWETEKLKLNVRKLKNLGLTISLGTGYRISPRGRMVMNKLGLV